MARPRPRTKSDNATCAETLRLERTAIQEAPAMRLAHKAVAGWRATPNRIMAIAVPIVAPAARASLAKSSLEPGERERPCHSAGANGAEQEAIEVGSAGDLVARDRW